MKVIVNPNVNVINLKFFDRINRHGGFILSNIFPPVNHYKFIGRPKTWSSRPKYLRHPIPSSMSKAQVRTTLQSLFIDLIRNRYHSTVFDYFLSSIGICKIKEFLCRTLRLSFGNQ